MTEPLDESRNPWRTLTVEKKYENPWISVSHAEILNPAGNPGIYGTVHFKNTAIGIVPLDAELNTWIVGQYRFPLEAYSWEIPEGGGPLKETTLEAAQRELREETGITAGEWINVLEMHLSNSVSDECSVSYLARDLTFSESTPEETEELQVRKLPFSEAIKMVMDGGITDSLSVASLLKVQYMIDQKLI